MKYSQAALDAYRERALNRWALMRWAGVAVILVGCAVAVYGLNTGGGRPFRIAALLVVLSGWAVIALAIWRRRVETKRWEAEIGWGKDPT